MLRQSAAVAQWQKAKRRTHPRLTGDATVRRRRADAALELRPAPPGEIFPMASSVSQLVPIIVLPFSYKRLSALPQQRRAAHEFPA
jgi:hypothetical protein